MAQPSKELPLTGEVFEVQGCTAFVIPAAGAATPTPWVWYAPTLANLPGLEEGWMLEQFAAAGLAVAESHGVPAEPRCARATPPMYGTQPSIQASIFPLLLTPSP